jgi:hypothetical protein
MSRRGVFLLVVAASALALGATTAQADTTVPTQPPGGVQVKPVSASAGGSSQSGDVSTGRAGAASDQQGTNADECGVKAGSTATGYVAPPAKAGTPGTTTPSCSTAGSTSTANGRQTAARQTTGANSNAAGSGNNELASSEVPSPAASILAGQQGAPWLGWLFLLLLLAGLFLLLGFAAGKRRRTEPTHA